MHLFKQIARGSQGQIEYALLVVNGRIHYMEENEDETFTRDRGCQIRREVTLEELKNLPSVATYYQEASDEVERQRYEMNSAGDSRSR